MVLRQGQLGGNVRRYELALGLRPSPRHAQRQGRVVRLDPPAPIHGFAVLLVPAKKVGGVSAKDGSERRGWVLLFQRALEELKVIGPPRASGVLLVREVCEEGTRRHPGSVCDLRHGHGVKASPREEVHRHLANLPTGLSAPSFAKIHHYPSLRLHFVHVLHGVHYWGMGTSSRHALPRGGGLTTLLVVMCVALALVIGAGSSLSLALPEIADATNATQTELTWVVNAYMLVFAALLLPVGIAADRFGRRPALLLGMSLFGAASVASGLAEDPATLIVLRGLAGVGAAAVMPATLSVLVDAYPEERRSSAVSIWAGVSGAGALLGILLAGVLLDNFWWGSVQIVYGAAAGLVVLACAAVVPASRNPSLSLDPIGGALSLTGLAGVVFGVIEGPERGWTSLPVILSFAAGSALLALFVIHELRSSDPMLDVRLFRSRLLSAGSILVFLQFFAAFGFFFLGPQWLQYVQELDALEASLWLLPLALGIGPASAAGPWLLTRLGPGVMAGWGMTQMAIAFLGFAWQGDGDQPMWVFGATLVVLGFGFGLAITPGTTLIIGGLPEDRRTLAAAVNDVTREVGGALGGAVAASVLLAVYADELSAGLREATVPPSAVDTAEDGVANALGAASTIGPQGPLLAQEAISAFSAGYAAALVMAAATLLLGAAVAVVGARRSPSHALTTSISEEHVNTATDRHQDSQQAAAASGRESRTAPPRDAASLHRSGARRP